MAGTTGGGNWGIVRFSVCRIVTKTIPFGRKHHETDSISSDVNHCDPCRGDIFNGVSSDGHCQDETAFVNLSRAEQVVIPSETSLPQKPFTSTLGGYSCAEYGEGISLLNGAITVKEAVNPDWICIIGPAWNAGLSNTNPTPSGPTIIANGEDDYQLVINFADPVEAVGFRFLTNSAASETITLTFSDGTTQVFTDDQLATEPNKFEFIGFRSSHAITQVKIDTTSGATQNEGIAGIWVVKNAIPTVEIISPIPGTVVSGLATFEVKYVDDDPSTVQWAIRQGTCAANTNTVWGNVDTRSDPFTWDGATFKTEVDTTSWSNGEYCFVFNPTESTVEGDIRMTQFYVVNQVPIANPGGPYLGAVGTEIQIDGSGSTDPANDVLTYYWDFGNGATGEGVKPTYTYPDAGIYNLCLTVYDGRQYSSQVCAMVVVYDPSGGFVTGGGWIDSPAGAYTVDPTLVGKATFGFVAKYQKGANIPTGNTEFQFKAGSMNFKSTSYDWLVVAGAKAKFKGIGTVNGAGEYGFMLSALDGTPDTFRIKIWEQATGMVIYDNLLGEANDSDPTTILSGGSIVIHK